MTSQPSFSPASTTPRRTALSPGQSPPLVRMPMRVFITKTQSKHFFRVDKPSAGRPLIVELPALANELGAFSKSTVAAEQDNDDAARKNPHALSFFHDFRFTACRKNQTFARPCGPSGCHTVYPLATEKFVGVEQNVATLCASVTK